MKKMISLFLLLLLLPLTIVSHAGFVDVSPTKSYVTSIDRIAALGIMNGFGNNEFQPDSLLTREQFAKVIISASGLDEEANVMKGATVFPDVNQDAWSAGFINLAIQKGFIKGMPDGSFHPKESVTFAQACTILVKALNYTDQDVPGLWPTNYVEKAKNLELTGNLQLDYNAPMPRWAIAVMLDKLLDTPLKKNNPNEADKTFAQNAALYTELIITGDAKTLKTLSQNQVLTDQGIYSVNSNARYEIGSKYAVVTDTDKIKSFVQKIGSSQGITVENAIDNAITYVRDGNLANMSLSEITTFYYKGYKVSFETAKASLKANTSIIFGKSSNKSYDAFGVIFDPVYSEAEVVLGQISQNVLGKIDFSIGKSIVRDGKQIQVSEIEERDVVYAVSDIWGKNTYIAVFGTKAEGTLTDIAPNKISPKSVKIDNVSYDLSGGMNLAVLSGPNAFNIEDKVSALLGYEKKVVAMYALTKKSGPFVNYKILGQKKYKDALLENQVLTDQGTFYLGVTGVNFEAGNIYKLVVDGDTIVRVGDAQEKMEYFTVDSVLGNTVQYKLGNKTAGFVLPQNIDYYYQGSKLSYASALSKVTANTTLAFAKNDQNTGYAYGVVFDPVFGTPEIVEASVSDAKSVGSIRLDSDVKVIRDREIIQLSQISAKDVLYEVTDIFGNYRYIYDHRNVVKGTIQSILPSRLTPQSMKLGNVTYNFSKYANVAALLLDDTPYMEGNQATLVIGKDGEILKLYVY